MARVHGQSACLVHTCQHLGPSAVLNAQHSQADVSNAMLVRCEVLRCRASCAQGGIHRCGDCGAQVIVLMRQVVPYTWMNYAAAAPPQITLPWYMLASVIGQVPHNAVDVYLGGNVTGLGDLLA